MFRRVLLVALLAAFWSGRLLAADQAPLEIASPHFTLVTDANEKQARHILENFERMRWMFQTLFPNTNVEPASPIVVLAVKNRKSLQAVEPEEYLAKGQVDVAGLFLKAQDKNYVLMRMDAEGEHPFYTVFHEYTHLQFASSSEWMPLWLNEGIAEFFQNTDFREKYVVLGQPSIDDIQYLREHSIIPLTDLFRVDRNSPYYHQENKASVFYAESWALTHYLQVRDRETGTTQVHDYMVLMSQHQDPVTSAEKAFGDIKQLQTALGLYIRQQNYKQFILSSAAAPIDSATYKVRVLTQSDYDGRRADFMAFLGRKKDARALLASVMAADARNAQARETMANMEMLDGNQEAARKWYEEAVKLGSQNYLAHYYFAALTLRDRGVEQGAEIESSLRSAIRLNPSFAASYNQLSTLYAMQNKKLEEAQNLNQKAIQLDRSNLSYRLNAENLFMMRGDYENAEKVLKLAAPLAKTTEESAELKMRLDQVASFAHMKTQAAALVDADATEATGPGGVHLVNVDQPPRHPIEAALGPKHVVIGVLTGVACSEPAVMDLSVDVAGKTARKRIALYASNYYKLDLTAFGFEPKAEMNPCKDIEGMKARVQYAESSDKSVDGQVIAIELRK